MSSSTDFRPASKRKGYKPAVIRPVHRRNGQQTFVRIDAAQDAVRSNIRALQLDDYVAQIRAYQRSENVDLQTAAINVAQANAEAAEAQSVPVKKGRVLRDTARQQVSSSAELTEADHLQILKAVAKIDAGYQWADERNRVTASASADFAAEEAIEETRAVEEPAVEPVSSVRTDGVSQALIDDIAIAIASVLTRRPEVELAEEVAEATEGVAEEPIQEIEATVSSPDVPRPKYTQPSSQYDFVVREAAVGQQFPPASHTISLSAAAWDVPDFRWTGVSDRILSVQSVLGGLAENCEAMLSPFGKTIAVTAPTRGQGTTTMSMTLARLFASCGKRVLLIDADIVQPRLSSTIGLKGISWFRNSASSEPVGECIVHGKNSGVCVMPLDAPIANIPAGNLPLFDRLEAQVEQVRNDFDLIVIDAGPVWQIVDEISSDSHLIDAAMLVNQDTHSNGFAEARERLLNRGVYRFIAAENRFAKRAG